jgi:hypothetical protein
MAASPVRFSPLFLVFLVQLLILVGCGGGNSTSTTAQAAYPVGYFRKTDGGTAKSAIAKTTTNTTVNMSYARIGHSETLLADGRVLIAGGNNTPVDNPNFTVYNNAELFDPATELFSVVPSTMSNQRTEQCAVILPDKRVLMLSGYWNYPSDLSLVDIFDPTTSTFSSQHVDGYQLLPLGHLQARINCIASCCRTSACSFLGAPQTQVAALLGRLRRCSI